MYTGSSRLFILRRGVWGFNWNSPPGNKYENASTYKTPSECGHKLILRVSFITGTQNNSTLLSSCLCGVALLYWGGECGGFCWWAQKFHHPPPDVARTPHPTIEMILLQMGRQPDGLSSLSNSNTHFRSAERCISTRAEIITLALDNFAERISSYQAFSILINYDAEVYPIISPDWKSVRVYAGIRLKMKIIAI